MQRQENTDSFQPNFELSQSKEQSKNRRHNKKLYTIIGGLAVVIIIIAALLLPNGNSQPVQLQLQYTAGDHMVYDISSTVTGQQTGIPLSSPAVYNSTVALDVIGFDGENYAINETLTTSLVNHPLPAITLNVSKTNYYDNFLAPGGPAIFLNFKTNPNMASFLDKSQVNIGDVWQMPVSTGNDSLGLTGEISLKFSGFQDITVPAGTYKTFRIDISTSNLTMHYDPAYLRSIHLAFNGNCTLQLSGSSYLEQSTCRGIKLDLVQYGTTIQQSAGNDAVTTVTSTIHTQKTLVKDT